MDRWSKSVRCMDALSIWTRYRSVSIKSTHQPRSIIQQSQNRDIIHAYYSKYLFINTETKKAIKQCRSPKVWCSQRLERKSFSGRFCRREFYKHVFTIFLLFWRDYVFLVGGLPWEGGGYMFNSFHIISVFFEKWKI